MLDDTQIRQGVGSVNLDLTQAIIPDREVQIDIVGYVGKPASTFRQACLSRQNAA